MKRNEIPLVYEGEGRFIAASSFWCSKADERYTPSTMYVANIKDQRSHSEHARFFASINEAWANLPEPYNVMFDTPSHLRKRGLIECGFYDQKFLALPNPETALEVAKFMEPDDHTVISVAGSTLVMRSPQSQSMEAMGQQQFRESVEKVERWAWALCGTTPEEANAHVGTIA